MSQIQNYCCGSKHLSTASAEELIDELKIRLEQIEEKLAGVDALQQQADKIRLILGVVE